MLIVTEKPSLQKYLKKELGPDCSFMTIFGGEHHVDVHIPEGVPDRASAELNQIIDEGVEEERIPFAVLDYFLARSILGAPGEGFRDALAKEAGQHNEVVFMIDGDYMESVSKRLARGLDAKATVTQVTSYEPNALMSAFDQRTAIPTR